MLPLLILATILLALWAWALTGRDGRTASVRHLLHVPLIGALTCFLMAIGLWIR